MKPGPHYNLSHKKYLEIDAVSQSLLKEFGEAATPLHFKSQPRKEATADMDFGTCCHTAILEPSKSSQVFVVRPEQYPDGDKMKPWHGGAGWCKDWLAKQGDKIVLSPDEAAKLPKIVKSISRDELVRGALSHGRKEVSWLKLDDETGLMLKARVDLYAVDANNQKWVIDLKKCRSGFAGEEDFKKQAYNLGYDIQCASYLEITGANRFLFLVFDDDEPFDHILWEPDADMMHAGYRRWRSLLLKYAACVKTNQWPGYGSGIKPLSLPKWATME